METRAASLAHIQHQQGFSQAGQGTAVPLKCQGTGAILNIQVISTERSFPFRVGMERCRLGKRLPSWWRY
jgi:hypothetical protein